MPLPRPLCSRDRDDGTERIDAVDMKNVDDLNAEICNLQERLSRFAETGVRINESLEFDAVLQSVLDSARSLTSARYGVMTLLDDEGRVQDFLASGMTAEEAEQLWSIPDSWQLFEFLTNIAEPLRLPDLAEHVRALGFGGFDIPLPVGVFRFLAVPMFHQYAMVGHIFVGDKDSGDEFTPTDEETLVMFASQASLVIANARTHREERRSKADLETLIETSPVGVVVFDAFSGAIVSINRETRRIVKDLWSPGQSEEDVLHAVTAVRADGREFSMNETPMSDLLKAAETVRVEEIVLKVPDGRSVTTLINATPIRAEDGTVESCVVTLQDITPIRNLERLRADFLGVVSHELRAPLTTIKGSAATLIEEIDNLEPAEMLQFFRIIDEQTGRARDLVGELLQVARIETGTLSVRPEPVDPVEVIDEAKIRFVNGGGRDDISIDMDPRLPRVMADRRRIVQVLGNLLSNAEKFSPSSSIIRIAATRKELHVEFSVADRGRGIPADGLPHLFSTVSHRAAHPTDDESSGSGLGLQICKGIVESHGGRIWAESDGQGRGARFTFSLPAYQGEPADRKHNRAESSHDEADPRRQQSAEQILVVDDDPEVLRTVRRSLDQAGYFVVVTGNPEEVPNLMRENEPSLVVMDVMLPGTDGIKLMKQISATDDVPVIFLSAYHQDEVVVKAFDQGAVDYIVKPFSQSELLARIRAALRRQVFWRTTEPQGPYVRQGLSIDYDERRVAVHGRSVDLTATEYNLLYELSANAPRVIGYDELLQRIWGSRKERGRGLVRTVVKRIRQKLHDDAGEPQHIFTVPRVGYMMKRGDFDDDRVAE